MTTALPADPARVSPRGHLRAVVLAAAAALVYANGLNSPFVWDDHNAVLENTQIAQLWPLSSPLSPPRDTPVAGRPLVNLSFAINHAISGFDVRAYHATNLAIHLLSALVLLGLVRRALDLDASASTLRSHSHDIAFVAALIWMLHPLQSEVVNYVTQRTTSMASLMLLLVLYCGTRALTAARRRRRWQAAAVLSCAAGMACKETMAVAPLLMVLFDRVFVYRSLRMALDRRRWLYGGLAATWIILAGLLSQNPRTTAGFDAGLNPWTYLLNQTTIIVHYLKLAVWPRALVLDYGVPQPLSLADVLGPASLLLGLGIATLVALVRWPRIGFLGAWFFITLAPTSSIVPIATEVGAERRMYLALAAIVVLAVCAGALLARAARFPKGVTITLCAGVCAMLAAGTIVRNREYRSPLSIAQTVVERRPHGRAHLALGISLLEAGRRPEAMDHFRRAKSLNAVGARFVLGTEFVVDGDLDAGIRELTEFVQRRPNHVNVPPAREALGRAFIAQGRLDAAAEQFTLLLQQVPGLTSAHQALGAILVEQNRPAEALPHLRHVAARRGGDVNALGKLGSALAASGRFEEAAGTFARAVEIDPLSAPARLMLGRTLAAQGRLSEAVEHFRLAVELAPENEQVRRYLEEAQRELSLPYAFSQEGGSRERSSQ